MKINKNALVVMKGKKLKKKLVHFDWEDNFR